MWLICPMLIFRCIVCTFLTFNSFIMCWGGPKQNLINIYIYIEVTSSLECNQMSTARTIHFNLIERRTCGFPAFRYFIKRTPGIVTRLLTVNMDKDIRTSTKRPEFSSTKLRNGIGSIMCTFWRNFDRVPC